MTILLLDASDDVAVTTDALAAGAVVEAPGTGPVELRSAVPGGHKFALRDVPTGGVVRKYGSPIGVASQPILRGDHVHVHNLDSQRAHKDGRQA